MIILSLANHFVRKIYNLSMQYKKRNLEDRLMDVEGLDRVILMDVFQSNSVSDKHLAC